jgi:cell division protein FtsB
MTDDTVKAIDRVREAGLVGAANVIEAEIKRLTAEIERLKAENTELREQIKRMVANALEIAAEI